MTRLGGGWEEAAVQRNEESLVTSPDLFALAELNPGLL